MYKDFEVAMSLRTDEELIKIVTVQRDDYQLLAIDAAEKEIVKRNIDSTKFDEIKNVFETEIEKQKAFGLKKVNSFKRLLNFIFDSISIIFFYAILEIIINWNDYVIILNKYLLVVAFFGYYIIMEYIFQKTIGKFITKTIVITENEEKVKLGDIVRRTLYRLIPFESISFLFSPNGFHDRLSKTRVIRDEK